MANEMTIAGLDSQHQLEALRSLFGVEHNTDLTEGVSGGFPVASFKGKVWRVKSRGEERKVLNADGDPISSLNAVIVRASPSISKIYYAKTYQEGDDSAPDCFSVDGVKPDMSVVNPPASVCASCPKNVWGSRVTDSGQKLKACSDSRRLAITPYPDIENGEDGPMMLRVPPASLQSLVDLATKLGKAKVPYSAVVVKIGFDSELAYPKLIFTPVRVLSEEEARRVAAVREHDNVERMFTEAHPTEAGEVAQDTSGSKGDDDLDASEEPASKPAEPKAEESKPAEPKAAPKPAEPKAAPKAEEPKAEEAKPSKRAESMDQGEVAPDGAEAELDDMISDMLNN